MYPRRLGVIRGNILAICNLIWFFMSIVYDARHSQAVIICDDFAAFIAARVAPAFRFEIRQ